MQFLSVGELLESALVLPRGYEYSLVALSFLVAVATSYVALEIASRFRRSGAKPQKSALVLSGGMTLGGGIWSMHLIAMLALSLPVEVAYDPLLTFLSAAISVIMSSLAFSLLLYKNISVFRLMGSGFLVGCGIAAMHYLGMGAMVMQARIYYQPFPFLFSICIGIIAATASLWLMINSEKKSLKIFQPLSAIVMSVAMSSMHYTGMGATIFVKDPLATPGGVKILDTAYLSLTITLGMITVIVLSMVVTDMKKRLSGRARLLLLVLIMSCSIVIVIGVALGHLYNIAYMRETDSLKGLADAYIEQIESSSHRERFLTGLSPEEVYNNIEDKKSNKTPPLYKQFGNSGRVYIARKLDRYFIFYHSVGTHKARYSLIPAGAIGDDPIVLAMEGKEGLYRGLDSQGRDVIAVYSYIDSVDVALTVSIDIADLKEAFTDTNLTLLFTLVVATLLGAGLFYVISNPMIVDLESEIERRRIIEKDMRLFRSLIDNSNEAFIVIDPSTARILDANNRAAEMSEYSAGELLDISIIDLDCNIPDLTSWGKLEDRITASTSGIFETRMERKNSAPLPVEVSAKLVLVDGQRYFFSVVRDITTRKSLEGKLLLATAVYENATEGIMVTDQKGSILYVNEAFSNITGYSSKEAIGNTPRILKSERNDQLLYKELWETLKAQGAWQGELWNRRKNGEAYPQKTSITSVHDPGTDQINYVSVFYDITEIRSREEQIKFQANYDALTQLPNRMLFEDRLALSIEYAGRNENRLGILFIDLDEFKKVNDSLGHRVGDTLLLEVARRLEKSVRNYDTVSRFGGDEFQLLIAGANQPKDSILAAKRIFEAFATPFIIEGANVDTSASIGIAIYPDDGIETETLVRNADLALYAAKRDGKNRFQLFTQEMNKNAQLRIELERDMRKSIEEEDFFVVYQPKVDAKSDAVVGMEALLRWRHPERGLIPPFEFIPIAEESNLILKLGDFVLRESCRQTKQWNETYNLSLCVAVNFSAQQFRYEDLTKKIALILDETGMKPEWLQMEVTESMVMGDKDTAISTMIELSEMGVSIAMDDFGTGYSSLSYLQQFPLHTVKIDQTFIRNAPEKESDKVLVKTIIQMGQGLGLTVVAEGVEELKHVELLRSYGCDLLQGYYFAKPMAANEFEIYIRRQEDIS